MSSRGQSGGQGGDPVSAPRHLSDAGPDRNTAAGGRAGGRADPAASHLFALLTETLFGMPDHLAEILCYRRDY